jgi:hypothetical protein
MVKTVVKVLFGIGVLWTATVIALPSQITDRIVDGVMDWGDKHISGPFKKGGGDEAATRKIIGDLLGKGRPGKIFVDISIGSESNTGTAEQDAPGYSQSHDGLAMPPGAHVQNLAPQPASIPSSINLNPEIHPVSPHTNTPQVPSDNWLDDHDWGTNAPSPNGNVAHNETHSVPSHPAPESHSGDGFASALQNKAGSADPGAPATQKTLEAGKTNLAQASPNVAFNPNPEATNTAPQGPPAAAAPAARPSPPAREHNSGGGRDAMSGAREITRGDFGRGEVARAGTIG